MVSLRVKFCSQLKLHPALRALSFVSAVSAAFICWWIGINQVNCDTDDQVFWNSSAGSLM